MKRIAYARDYLWRGNVESKVWPRKGWEATNPGRPLSRLPHLKRSTLSATVPDRMSTETHFLRLFRWLMPHRLLNPASGPWVGLLRRLFPSREARHPFDRTHRVDTGGLIYADGLSTGHEHDVHSSGYYATAPSLFRGAMEHWSATLEASPFRLTEYAFVDIGCGKGRVVLLASEHAFREVVGVELNPQLASMARRNLQRWMSRKRACRNVSIVQQDALSFTLPDGPLVLFFFNSFEREMVQMWLDRLVAVASSRSDPIDLIYLHPEHHKVIAATPGIRILADAEIAFSPRDAAADAFGVSLDHCTIYRVEVRRRVAEITSSRSS
jgi:SAM-dependent methyltransferase